MESGRVILTSGKEGVSLALAGHSCSDSVTIKIPCAVYLQRLLMQSNDCLTQHNRYSIKITR